MSDSAPLAPLHADALVRVIEGAPQVRRRHHFFMWTQGPMQQLLPHRLAVCGAYQRHLKELVFEAFHSVAVPASVLAAMTDARSALMQSAAAAWVANRGRPLLFDPAARRAASAVAFEPMDASGLVEAGYGQLLVHGVARPQRPNEIETLFVFASPERLATEAHLLCIDLMLPHLHNAYLRMQAMERELASGPAAAARPRDRIADAGALTAREQQILRGVRDGKNNQEIGDVLAISPLTVKNHVQKILRKLGAANRAQAVAMAMSMQLLGGDADRDA